MRNRTPDSSHRMREELQSENTQALLDRLETEMAKEEIDAELVEAILEALDEKAPVNIPRATAEENLREFRSRYTPILAADTEQKKVHPRGRKVLRVAMAACLCAVMVLAVAQACGVNLIAQFLEWREETFVLGAPSSGGQMVLDSAPEGEFTSMAEALASYGITDPVAPTWIPEGFHVEYARAKEQAHAVNLTARYVEGEKAIVIKAYIGLEENDVAAHLEHSELEATPYESNGVTFVLTDNDTQYRASWVIGACTCSINGDLTEGEIKEMIDSIFVEER